MPTLTHSSAPATLWADPHPPKGRHWGWVCEVGGTSYWAVPHQYPPPQPTHTDPCKYLMLQKTEEPRHLPESVGQIPLSRSFSGAASALSQLQGPHHAAELIVLSRKAAKPLHLPARPQGTGLGSAGKPWGASTFLPTHAAVRSKQKSPRLLQPTASHNVALSRVSGKMEEAPLPKTGKECAATALSQAGGVRWGMAAAATWGAVRNA